MCSLSLHLFVFFPLLSLHFRESKCFPFLSFRNFTSCWKMNFAFKDNDAMVAKSPKHSFVCFRIFFACHFFLWLKIIYYYYQSTN